MHELSISQSIVDLVLAELSRMEPKPARILSVRVAAGALRQIVPSCLQDAYRFLAEGTAVQGSSLELRALPLKSRCRSCGRESESPGFPGDCPSCGSAEMEITGGAELYVESVEVEDGIASA